ncbi:MAG: hypothetical protein P8X50_05845 [Maritimibacter sp.]
MTALSEFERLEAPGLWRPTPEAQRLNVIVSVGDATLTISDMQDRPLSHWSLPALHRLNPGKSPALYAPSDDPDEAELLETEDRDMIAAIDRVHRAIERQRPHSGRLRLFVGLSVLAAVILLAVFWLPGALLRQTVAVLPPASRATLGQQLLTRMVPITGQPCQTRYGNTALTHLQTRLLGGQPARLLIVPDGVAGATHLPGGIILINRDLVESYDGPDVIAGYILAESARAEAFDPIAALLRHAGVFATARFLTSGNLPGSALSSYAESLLTTPPTPLPNATLLARFAEAKAPSTPYAYALDKTGETTLGLIEADPVPLAEATPLLSDSDWVALQGICSE